MSDETKEAGMTEFQVLREHEGDRFYRTGETREAKEGDVAHLVKSGVLRAGGEKSADKPENKADPKPDNKAAPKPANKAG